MAAPVLSAAHSPTPASFAVPMAPLPLPTTSLSWVPPQVPANPHPPPPLSLICLRYHFEGGSEADEWHRPCVYLTHEQLLQCVEHQGFDIALVQPSLQPSLYTSATILSSRGCCVSRRRQRHLLSRAAGLVQPRRSAQAERKVEGGAAGCPHPPLRCP